MSNSDEYDLAVRPFSRTSVSQPSSMQGGGIPVLLRLPDLYATLAEPLKALERHERPASGSPGMSEKRPVQASAARSMPKLRLWAPRISPTLILVFIVGVTLGMATLIARHRSEKPTDPADQAAGPESPPEELSPRSKTSELAETSAWPRREPVMVAEAPPKNKSSVAKSAAKKQAAEETAAAAPAIEKSPASAAPNYPSTGPEYPQTGPQLMFPGEPTPASSPGQPAREPERAAAMPGGAARPVVEFEGTIVKPDYRARNERNGQSIH